MSVSLRAVFVFVSEHLCVSEDTFKADACFKHVGESLTGIRFVCLCVCGVCVCEMSKAGRLMTLVASHHGSST